MIYKQSNLEVTFETLKFHLDYVAQCHRGYQIGQDLCECIQKSKGCVTSKKAYLTFLWEEVFHVLFSLGIPSLFICVHSKLQR